MARVSTLSPLRIFLSAIFLFSAHVFAVSAVMGVDLGTEYIKAALVKPGIPLEIVLTKDSRRKEISAVAFKPSSNGPKKGVYPEREYGSDAMAIAPRFPGDVYPNLKTILGLPAGSAEVREYAERHPALKLEAHKTKGTAAFKSAGAFTQEEEAWLVEELLAMELQSIRANAEALAGPSSSVRSVVITVPPFYTVEEKRAVELAAELAGLKVLSLISDGLAVGLNYATSRQFPNVNKGEKAENHLIFDMGAGSTKATVLQMQSRTVKDVGKFNKTIQEVTVLGSGWDRTLGGDALNYLIVDDMIRQFVESPKAQKAGVTLEAVKSHGRTIAKLTKEAERLRHVLSANQNTQASFEGLYDDVDFKYKITRAEFEEMATTHAQRVSLAVNDALTMAGLQIKDLDSVILHGGASRTPFVQKELENVLGGAVEIRTNVNSDEAAVFGAGFRAAELSPSFRVKEIKIADGASYPAGMRWKNDEGKPKHQRLWTATSHLGAPAKEVTFNNVQDLTVNFYQLLMDGVEVDTKVFTTKNLTASVEALVEKHKCEKSDIKFKVGVRLLSENGEVDVTKAAVECETDEPEKAGIVDGVKNLFGFGKKDKTEGEEDSSASTESATTSSSTTTSTSSSASASASAESTEPKKKQLVQINVDFTLAPTGPASLLPKASVQTLKDRLKSFATSDRNRQLREEALNQLEAYTYKISDILDRESFIAHSTAAERETLQQKKDDASDWLYGDGADATREDFRAKLKELQAIVDPVLKRAEEAEKRPEILKGLQDALANTKTFVKDIREKIAAYEAFHSSASASASASSSIASSSSTTEAPAPSATGDFDGLEDDSPTTATPEDPMKALEKDLGPVPPLYTLDDLKESEDLYTSISTWLELKVAEQEKLNPTDDPVLTVKELLERREKLDKAGMALAMKGVKNFEKTQQQGKNKGGKASGGKGKGKAGGEKGKKNGGKKKAGEKVEENKKAEETTVTDEEIEEMLRKVMEEEKVREQEKKGKEKKEEGIKHEEL